MKEENEFTKKIIQLSAISSSLESVEN